MGFSCFVCLGYEYETKYKRTLMETRIGCASYCGKGFELCLKTTERIARLHEIKSGRNQPFGRVKEDVR